MAFYQTYFNNAYPSWRTWRAGKVEVDQQEYSGSNHECDIKVTDLLTNIAHLGRMLFVEGCKEVSAGEVHAQAHRRLYGSIAL